MSKDLFDDFPSSRSQGGSRATNGGNVGQRDVMGYATPYGIKNQTRGPGLGADNFGNGQTPSGAKVGGSPGLGGKNYTNSGSQGKR